jgi:two-component system nitrate/nitrite sensor histidine kinase NarX
MQVYLGQGDYQRLTQAIKESHQALSEAYTDTRKAIDDLRMAPPQNLHDWLEQFAQDFERENGIPVCLRIAADMPELQSEVQVQLMRIIQEALNNVRKHARACQVELDAHCWNQDWIIQIQDDGLGFCQDEVPEYSRYGLRGMRERSEAIGADFQVVSKPGKGTTVMIRLPVPHQEVED